MIHEKQLGKVTSRSWHRERRVSANKVKYSAIYMLSYFVAADKIDNY